MSVILMSASCHCEDGYGSCSLTDVIIKAHQGAAELCAHTINRQLSIQLGCICAAIVVPLSPFMTTHIREPTHLSMSSAIWLACPS